VHTCKTGHGWAVDFQRHCRAPQRIYSFLGALLTARTSSRNSRIYSVLGALLTARTSSRNSRILFLLMMGECIPQVERYMDVREALALRPPLRTFW
jgi:hypothetical protein